MKFMEVEEVEEVEEVNTINFRSEVRPQIKHMRNSPPLEGWPKAGVVPPHNNLKAPHRHTTFKSHEHPYPSGIRAAPF